MRSPRVLDKTLPSPSEMDNFHRCPCLWVMKDRLWVHPLGDHWPLLYGRMIDDVCGAWLLKQVTTLPDALAMFDALVQEHRPPYEDEYYDSFGVSTKDALRAWIVKFGTIAQGETIVDVQPKISGEAKVKIDYVVRESAGLVIRERKLVSGFADLDDELMRYELGFQPICYKEMAEKHYQEHIAWVEMEFLVRSVPAKGRYKAKEASARRDTLHFDYWHQDMWYNTALYTNEMMKTLERSLESDHQFVSIPRFTRNCLVKLGNKTYPCDFHKACKVMMSPLLMPEQFICDRKEAPIAQERTDSAGVRSRLEPVDGADFECERVPDGSGGQSD